MIDIEDEISIDKSIKSKKKKLNNIFMESLINKKISIPITNIGNNYKEIIKKLLQFKYEGKCIEEGYIQPDSINIINISSGLIKSFMIEFDVVFSCQVCCPVEGMKINCIVKNVTKAEDFFSGDP